MAWMHEGVRRLRELLRREDVAQEPGRSRRMGACGAARDGCFEGLRDRAGADPAEWPEDLRVREFPQREQEGGR